MGVLEGAKNALASATPKVEPENTGAAFLMGSIAAIGAILAALGLSGGLVGRMARNYGLLTALSLFCALSAVALGFLAAYSNRGDAQRKARREHLLLNGGIALFVVAGIFAVWAGVLVWNARTSPQVTASAKSSPHGDLLELTAKGTGLQKDDRLHLTVWPLASESTFETVANGGTVPQPHYQYVANGLPLYQSITGPDADGNVDLTTQARLSPDHPERVVVQAAVGPSDPSQCFEGGNASGCVILDLGAPGRPQLSASWKATGGNTRVVTLRSSAEEIGGRTVYVRAYGQVGRKQRLLADEHLAPDVSGGLDESTDVNVPGGTTQVCAVASTLAPQVCPPRNKPSKIVVRTCVDAIAKEPALGPNKPTTLEQAGRRCRSNSLVQQRQGTSWIRLAAP